MGYDAMHNRLWVSDAKNARLQVFTADGDYIGQWACGLHAPSEIVVNQALGLMYVAQMPKPAAITVLSFSNQTKSSIGECNVLQNIDLGQGFANIGHMMGPGNTPMP